MGYAGAQQTETHKAILFLQLLQRVRKIIFLTPKLGNRGVPGPHDLADLVAEDKLRVDQFVFPVPGLRSVICFEHQSNGLIDVLRHDDQLKHRNREQIDSAEHYEQADARLPQGGIVESGGQLDPAISSREFAGTEETVIALLPGGSGVLGQEVLYLRSKAEAARQIPRDSRRAPALPIQTRASAAVRQRRFETAYETRGPAPPRCAGKKAE